MADSQSDPTGRGASAPPAAIVFDVNETLSDLSPLEGSFAAAGLDPRDVAPWFSGVLRDAFALNLAGENPAFADVASDALRLRLAAAGRDEEGAAAGAEELLRAFTSLGVHPDVVEGVEALRARGIRLLTLSNGSAEVAEGLLGRAGVLDSFEALLSVEEGSAWKPHPDSYARALEERGISPEDAMLVAVHPWDVHGAVRAGLRGCWLNRDGAPRPAVFAPAGVEVGDLRELADALAGG
ncbi:haloacid dehalogenase type II [Rothia sp. AR01]|uniref:Haloacid dehalogenase type II n=1 Tax=Rothia santali TaxID=2949643 RepID=A0A9X2KM71_9MICC|nr:haloacid dehalogenase type II [Rothia santali]MCP3426881.1 haloacid dehalogenase type II [Rothia santali]